MFDPFQNPFGSPFAFPKRPPMGGIRRPRPVQKPEDDAPPLEEEKNTDPSHAEESETRPKATFKKAGWGEEVTRFGAEAAVFAEFAIPESEKARTLVEFQLWRQEEGKFKPYANGQGHVDASGKATAKIPIHKDAADKETFQVKARHGSGEWSSGEGTDREVTESAAPSFEHTLVSGLHFPKNSSFIEPGYLKVFRELEKSFAEWKKSHPNAQVVVFGHSESDETDPRKLSARRGEITWAFLNQDHQVWGLIAREERWGVREQQHMLQAMGFYPGKVDGLKGPQTEKAIKDFIGWINEKEGKSINPMLGFTEEYIRLDLYRVYITGPKRAISLPSKNFREVSGFTYVGCGAVNRYKEGNGHQGENRRATFLLISESTNFPAAFPCKYSTTGPCDEESRKTGPRAIAGFKCKFYDEAFSKEKVGEASESDAAEDNDTIYVSYPYTLDEAVKKQMALNPPPQKNVGTKWIDAPEADAKTAMDSTQHESGADKFQFIDLSCRAELSVEDADKFLHTKGILKGQGKAFVEAAQAANISEIYGIAHACLETGHGTSQLAKGVEKDDGKKYHNMFGIHAFDKSAVESGSNYAQKMGWDTPDKAIRGGIKWIAENFINQKGFRQNTLYKMRWNPEKPGQHQYATDAKWALAQAPTYKKFYDAFPTAKRQFEIPRYKGQPDWKEPGSTQAHEDTPAANSALTDSVGLNGKNSAEDVKLIQKRLQDLQYPIEAINGTCDSATIKAIRMFQIAHTDVEFFIKSYAPVTLPDGLINKGKNTEKNLFSENAKRYAPPAKGATKPVLDDVLAKKNSAKGDVVKIWDSIMDIWNTVSPYLPAGSSMSSGYRTADDQRTILHNWYNSKYKEEILDEYGEPEWKKYHDMQGKNDAVADVAMVKMIKGATKQLIAVPGNSPHQYGKAIDVGGQNDATQIRALLWCSAEFPEKKVVTKILPERNGCLHFEFSK